jgi:chemotaxis protein CheD
MSEDKQHVGIGEYKVKKGGGILESVGLGSCIGVCLWDKIPCVGGLSHVMLPSSQGRSESGNPFRYADKAIPAMMGDMVGLGASRKTVIAKIFGGASLFQGVQIQVGDQNLASVRGALAEYGIKIVAEEVGGTHGRSIWFDVKNGSVVVGKVFGETREY